MRLSVAILPTYRWPEAREIWLRAEALGFDTAYTYDHLSWRSFRDEPWFGAVPTLTAAATVTSTLRLGTLVASPNFRHPVTFAKELMTLDDISGGRLTLGIGAGGVGFDATAFGQEPWSAQERADRLGEFVPLLDTLLTQESTTFEGAYYSAAEARMIPGCIQQPRIPFYVAATGPRGLRLAAQHGQGWVTYGDPRGPADVPVDQAPAVIADQIKRLEDECAAQGRSGIHKVLLQGSTAEQPLASVAAFEEWAGIYTALGVDELVIHWPIPDSIYDTDMDVFEEIVSSNA